MSTETQSGGKKGLVKDQNARFVDFANPHSWLLTADNLHEQALHLYSRKGQSILTQTDGQNLVLMSRDGVNKSIFLLGGFALENAIKAFLVFENPHWISNGALSTKLLSHSLTKLQAKSALIPFKHRSRKVLQQFEEGLNSWARYPCSLHAATSMDEGMMPHELWLAYIRLMGAYGKRLTKLLSGGWNGPHGFYGRWTFSGGFLS